MIQVALMIKDEPDFYPDHLDLEALPPVTTMVTIDKDAFMVVGLRLVVRQFPVSGGGHRHQSYYVATLKRMAT